MGTGAAEVTIVVVGHSVRGELAECLDSVAAHAVVDHEVVVVDNASTDGTVEWLREAHPQVRVVVLDRNEFGAARNHALPFATGRYVLFVDSDTRLTAGALPELVGALDEHPGWGAVAPKLVYPDGELQLSCRRFPPFFLPVLRRPPLDRFFDDSRPVRRHLMAEVDHAVPRAVVYAISACLLFRASLVSRIGLIDERLAWGGEDVDWCIRIRDAGYDVVYLPDAVVVHSYRRLTRRHPVSRAALRHLRSFAWLQWKYRRRQLELHRLGHTLGSVTR